jgi:hypothetical protein
MGPSATAVGFLFFWPLAFVAVAGVWVCTAYTEPESCGGVLTVGGKRMARSRVFLGIGCAIYCLCIAFGVAFNSIDDPALVLGFWLRHWNIFMALVVSAEASMLIAMAYSFQASGDRIWLIRVATVILVMASTFVTLLFLRRS